VKRASADVPATVLGLPGLSMAAEVDALFVF